MKSKFSFLCILGLSVFLSQLTPGIAALPVDQRLFFANSEEIQEYTSDVVVNILKTADAIMSVPYDQRIKNDSYEPVNLYGSSEEESNPAVEFTALNLKYEFQPEDNVFDFATEILSENADVVYIQEVFANDDVYSLYEFLRNDYAHFIYVPAVNTLDFPRNHHHRGLLIASKYFSLLHQPPANMKFRILPIKSRSNRNENQGEQRYEGGITGKWGEGKGVQWEGYVKGEAHDGKGNYAEGKITQKDDGTGEVDIRGGHESQKK